MRTHKPLDVFALLAFQSWCCLESRIQAMSRHALRSDQRRSSALIGRVQVGGTQNLDDPPLSPTRTAMVETGREMTAYYSPVEGSSEGAAWAHVVLGLTEGSSDKKIRKAYRTKYRYWHPDRIKRQEATLAEEKFQKIQKAYSILTKHLSADIKARDVGTIEKGAKGNRDRAAQFMVDQAEHAKQKQLEAELRGYQTPEQTGSQRGTVKAWSGKGGYGFLVPDNGGPDVFVHWSALTGETTTLHAGEAVIFDLQVKKENGKYFAVSCYSTSSEKAPDASSFDTTASAKAPKSSESSEAGTGADACIHTRRRENQTSHGPGTSAEQSPSRAHKADRQKKKQVAEARIRLVAKAGKAEEQAQLQKQKQAEEESRQVVLEAEREAEAARRANATSHFHTGIFVVAKRLKEAAHLNGQAGIIKSFDEEKGCYLVDFEGPHGEKLLEPDNLDFPWSLS